MAQNMREERRHALEAIEASNLQYTEAVRARTRGLKDASYITQVNYNAGKGNPFFILTHPSLRHDAPPYPHAGTTESTVQRLAPEGSNGVCTTPEGCPSTGDGAAHVTRSAELGLPVTADSALRCDGGQFILSTLLPYLRCT